MAANNFTLSNSHVINLQRKQSELAVAGRSKDADSLRRCLSVYIENANIQALDEIYALHWACYIGSLDLVECLVRLGCDLYNADGLNLDTACHYAVRGANLDVLVFLFRHAGSDILQQQNRTHMTPFLTASAEVSEERTTQLLRIMEWMYIQGVSLEQQDNNGQTALFWAAKRGSVHIVQWLLSKGCNMAHRDHVGHTVLHVACMTNTIQQQDYQDTLLFLCEKGAINLVNSKSLESESSVGSTVFRICLKRRHYFMYISLWKWRLQFKLFGFVKLFRSAYAWCYWILTLANLALFINMWANLSDKDDGAYNLLCGIWMIIWFCSQICWFITFVSDPGYVLKNTIPNQFHRLSSNFAKDIESSPVYPAPKGSALYNLQRLEREQLLLNLSLIELNQECYKRKCSAAEDRQYNEILDKLLFVKNEAIKSMSAISCERMKLYPPAYVAALLNNQPFIKNICVTCKIIKPTRVHHCADCAHCIKREDHHCVWIDNCVALQNQRSFWCFLLLLIFSILCNFNVIRTYLYHFFYQPKHFLCICLAFIFGILLNTMWLCFIVYLLLRTTKAMITNVTFYEYLKKPEHIRLRFKDRMDGFFWDFSDLSIFKIFRNIWGFWSLSASLDEEYEQKAGLADASLSRNKASQLSRQNALSVAVDRHAYLPVNTPNNLQHSFLSENDYPSSGVSFFSSSFSKFSPPAPVDEYRKNLLGCRSPPLNSYSNSNIYCANYIPLPQV